MGQYHLPVNLTKNEYLNPHAMGLGLKQWEQVHERTAMALVALLSCSNGRGGGDLPTDTPTASQVLGRWAGDQIAFVGDYSDAGDIPGYDGIERVYGLCGEGEADLLEGETLFTDITPLVTAYIEESEDGIFIGSGWRQFVRVGGRVAVWGEDVNSSRQEKITGTVVRINREQRYFTVRWDGDASPTKYKADGKIPYFMESDVPAPVIPELVTVA